MPDVLMPRLSDSMEEGTIVRWLVVDGDQVQAGSELVEIETDKANMVYEVEVSGPLQIVAAEGETVAIGEPIARVGADEAVLAGVSAGAASKRTTPSGRATGPVETAVTAGSPASPSSGDRRLDRPNASPVARRLAADLGIDLALVSGSGPRGRIVKADVEAHSDALDRQETAGDPPAAPAPTAKPASRAVTAPVDTAKGAVETIELTRVQQLVARRMAESKATAPDFALTRDLDMDAAVELRTGLKRWAAADGKVPSYNDLVVKACALALRDHPRANGAYRDGRWELYSRVNVGIAVAGPGGSLIVPTIFDADRIALAEIARASRRLAAAARDGSVTAPELSGGTFTVSNLGMFGVSSFTAIVNPPQAAILAIGALEQRAIVRDNVPAVGWRMAVTLCCDHRILTGADGAALLARVAELLESPGALIL
jgi:pyruvate dehydrogenase E2 component (dihydrolipoyllysine-residue acetyltransferase)